MRGKDGKFHLLYKVTNQLNNRFYIGKHSTRILEDGYLGSGKRIRYEVKKYGKENFVREIMEFCESDIKLNEREKTLVNPETLKDKMCMNIKEGGDGGWKDHNIDPANKHHRQKGGTKTGTKNLRKAEATRSVEEWTEIACRGVETKKKKGIFEEQHKKFQEAAKTPEAIEKKKQKFKEIGHQQGEKNSQFGKQWIYSIELQQCIRISKDQSIPEGWKKGRKMKF
jgi:hypothetical protein